MTLILALSIWVQSHVTVIAPECHTVQRHSYTMRVCTEGVVFSPNRSGR